MQKIKELLIKYREIIVYLVFGVLTTAVNYISLFVLQKLFDGGEYSFLILNVPAWLISVVFAFITNKLFVFESRSWKFSVASKEFLEFCGARVLSLAIEELILFIFVNLLFLPEWPVKIAASVFVVIFNYVASKLVIFKKDRE